MAELNWATHNQSQTKMGESPAPQCATWASNSWRIMGVIWSPSNPSKRQRSSQAKRLSNLDARYHKCSSINQPRTLGPSLLHLCQRRWPMSSSITIRLRMDAPIPASRSNAKPSCKFMEAAVLRGISWTMLALLSRSNLITTWGVGTTNKNKSWFRTRRRVSCSSDILTISNLKS